MWPGVMSSGPTGRSFCGCRSLTRHVGFGDYFFVDIYHMLNHIFQSQGLTVCILELIVSLHNLLKATKWH